MDFSNSFGVRAPLSTVWDFMLDAQRVTPCVPGAHITETVDDTHYKGTVKVKLGAVQMTYRGELEMEANEAEHTIVLRARGTETRGSGGASGTVTTRLAESEDGVTTVEMQSHVDVTGRVAQFGRGIMQDVANRLTREFAQCLESTIQAGAGPSEEPPAPNAVSASADGPAAGQTTAETQSATRPSPAPPPAPPGDAVGGTGPGTQKLSEAALDAARSKTAAGLRAMAHDPPPRPAPPPGSPPVPPGGAMGGTGPAALSLGRILVDVARARTAAGLRALARAIEPD